MKVYKLKDFKGGWVVGDFLPTLFASKDFEVAVKNYKKDDYEKKHHHKLATEITIIGKGSAEMNNVKYYEGDIIYLEPNDSSNFKALEDVITFVIKFPSIPSDKYVDEE